jgi:hypothetical protein
MLISDEPAHPESRCGGGLTGVESICECCGYRAVISSRRILDGAILSSDHILGYWRPVGR